MTAENGKDCDVDTLRTRMMEEFQRARQRRRAAILSVTAEPSAARDERHPGKDAEPRDVVITQS